MAVGELAGTVITASGPTNGAAVTLWLASRLSSQPSQGTAAPGGAPDYGPQTSGTGQGGPGAFSFTSVTEGTYYVLAVFSATNYWSGPYSVLENSDVVHISGTETVTGDKIFTGTIVLGKGTAVTTANGSGATRNTLDDASGNAVFAGTLRTNSNSPASPDFVLGTPDTGAPTYTTTYGLNLDQNSAIAINAKAGQGVYTQADGVKKNILDDGAGNASVAGALTIANGLTLGSGVLTLPNASIPLAAIQGFAGAANAGVDTSTSQVLTGQKQLDNDLLLKGSQLIGTAIATPTAPTVTATGGTGGTTWQYRIVATTYDGRDSIPSTTGQVTNGVATLDATHYNHLVWPAVSDAASYKVLKWNGSVFQLYVGGLTGTTYDDKGTGSPAAYTAAAQNPGGEVSTPLVTVAGLVGAALASRYVGATASGPPTSGTFAARDFVIDGSGSVHVCTTAGSPGTWRNLSTPKMPYRARMHLQTGYNNPSSAWFINQFDSIDYDPNGNCTAGATAHYTVPIDGVYRVSVMTEVNLGPGTVMRLICDIAVNTLTGYGAAGHTGSHRRNGDCSARR